MSNDGYNITGLSPSAQAALRRMHQTNRASAQGAGCLNLREPIPHFNLAQCEKVIEGKNNSYIVLGRDRTASLLSGYGGKGHTQASMIDMVVGRMAHAPMETAPNGEEIIVDPNFRIDSARIYISQKTDIDQAFSLAAGTVGNSVARSGIGIKADDVRIIGREGIKLVTRTDIRNSQGIPCDFVKGIDLIAGNDDSDLQPIPKGDNVKKALDRIVAHMSALNGIVHNFIITQSAYNRELANHWHHSPFYGQPTQHSIPVASAGARAASKMLGEIVTSLMNHKVNLENFKQSYLSQSGGEYINSRYNNVN
jgi:hypothetical protein